MARRVANWILASSIALAYHVNSQAEEIKPTAVQYRFGKLPGNKTDECGVVLFISTYPSPETTTVRYSMIRSLADGKVNMGLAIEVFDAEFVNGHPEKFNRVALSRATFSSDHFSSDGRMLSFAMADGSIWLGSPSDTVSSDMTNAFSLGDFHLSFSRVGSKTIRSYSIHEAVPAAILEQFTACAGKMTGQ